MKLTKTIIKYSSLILLLIGISGCEDQLNAPVHSQLAPSNFLVSEEGMENTLASAYGHALFHFTTKEAIAVQEMPTDITFSWGGGFERIAVQYVNYTWDANTLDLIQYDNHYEAIRNSNIILENFESAEISNSKKTLLSSEARFIRAYSYYQLFLNFGPVPLRTSTSTTTQDLELPRASEEDMLNFIETEFQESIAGLPEPGNEPAYQRAHKGAARGLLTEFYMNTKQWQKAVDMADEVINMGVYELYPVYADMFKVENERNREYIWIIVCNRNPNRATTNGWMNAAFPNNLQRVPKLDLDWKPEFVSFGANYTLRKDFVQSFLPGDTRFETIVTEWINTEGDTIKALEQQIDNARDFKWLDRNPGSRSHGNDIPIIRYADILMLKAEALNELQGPNQVSIDLINQIRARAGISDISLNDFNTKEELRNHIMKERAWEFRSEGKRRNTLIRMGKLIENANDRGITNAQPHHTRFPIPQSALDANPALEQNPGY